MKFFIFHVSHPWFAYDPEGQAVGSEGQDLYPLRFMFSLWKAMQYRPTLLQLLQFEEAVCPGCTNQVSEINIGTAT